MAAGAEGVEDSPGQAVPSRELVRRGGRVAEGARLESVYTGNRIEGSNPSPSASPQSRGRFSRGRLRSNPPVITAFLICPYTGDGRDRAQKLLPRPIFSEPLYLWPNIRFSKPLQKQAVTTAGLLESSNLSRSGDGVFQPKEALVRMAIWHSEFRRLASQSVLRLRGRINGGRPIDPALSRA